MNTHDDEQPSEEDSEKLKWWREQFPSPPCPGCGQQLEPGETCQICRSMANIRRLNACRKGIGRFATLSQPKDN